MATFKIDKGILGSFLLLIGLVALVGTLFFMQYIYAITLGSVFQSVANSSSSVDVTNDTFAANGTVAQSLANGNITTTGFTIYNNTDDVAGIAFDLDNFTIDYTVGTVLNGPISNIANGTELGANYTYTDRFSGTVPLTRGTRNFLTTTEGNYFSTSSFVNNGALFAGGLIVVAVVLVIFGGVLVFGRKKKGKGLDY